MTILIAKALNTVAIQNHMRNFVGSLGKNFYEFSRLSGFNVVSLFNFCLVLMWSEKLYF